MSTEETQEQEAINYLDMSDEDMAKLEMPTKPVNTTVGDDTENSSDDETDTNLGDENDDGQAEESGNGGDSSGESDSGTEDGDTSSESGSASEEGEAKTGDVNNETDTDDNSGSEGETGSDKEGDGEKSGQDVKSQSSEVTALSTDEAYKQIMQPFKANGKQMEVKTVDEVRRLMSMGANYNSKMAAMKPNLKILKMLENNDILSEEKLSYLIDLNKKDPKAITQLIKDSGINPLEVDVEQDTGYKSNTYTVSDNEVDLDQVLKEVNSTDTGERTVDILSNRWDEASRTQIVSDPKVITVINDQVASGIYDQITSNIERARMLGEYTGVNDFDAYKQMGNHMHVNRLFKGMQDSSPTTLEKKAETNTLVKPVTKADDLQLKNRKKAASATKSGNGIKKKKLTGLDILDMPDEEFDKLSAPV